MLQRFIITKVKPWTEYNEYEGEVEGIIDNFYVHCYTLVPSIHLWNKYVPEICIEVDIWLERIGEIHITKTMLSPFIRQVKGIQYEVTGTIIDIQEEQLYLDFTPSIRIDLDISKATRHLIPQLQIGNAIYLQGTLKVDLDPEDD